MSGADLATEPASVTHDISRPETHWSRTNAAESVGTVLKPLPWDVLALPFEKSMVGAAVDLGGLPEPEIWLPADASERIGGCFYGRFSLNVDRMSWYMGSIPGFSSSDHVRDFLGRHDDVDVGDKTSNIEEREAIQAARTATIKDLIRAQYTETLAWWRAEIVDRAIDPQRAAGMYAEATEQFTRTSRDHSVCSTLAQQCFSKLAALLESVGLTELKRQLTTGYGGTEDTELVITLWHVSRGEGSLDDIIRRWGFQSPFGDDISVPSWREDRKVVEALAQKYARMPEENSPVLSEAERTRERLEAEERLLAVVGPDRRAETLELLRESEEFMRLREMGKSTFRRRIDAIRAICRAQGKWLAESGKIADPADVYFLTVAEAFYDFPPNAQARMAERKAAHERHLRIEVPISWQGNPVPELIKSSEQSSSCAPIKGIGASPGVLQGRARVVLSQEETDDFEPGDILVTRTTDPSWAPFMLVASGLVIDIGGAMSHGAIIARELGIPCVIGTQDGTRRIRNGETVRMDGSTGQVSVIDHAG